jgi:hypothetical protein
MYIFLSTFVILLLTQNRKTPNNLEIIMNLAFFKPEIIALFLVKQIQNQPTKQPIIFAISISRSRHLINITNNPPSSSYPPFFQ